MPGRAKHPAGFGLPVHSAGTDASRAPPDKFVPAWLFSLHCLQRRYRG
jgi:hypothetical protein